MVEISWWALVAIMILSACFGFLAAAFMFAGRDD